VRWQDGVRYVDDGDVITSAGVLSGVDGALRVVERIVGQPAAARAARAVQWPAYSPGRAAPIQRSRPAPADVVPGADADRHAAAGGLSLPVGLTPVYLHGQPGFAFDAALRDIARTRDVATARWVAKSLQHPSASPSLSGPTWPWTLTLRPILIAAAAAAVAAAVVVVMVRRRGVPPKEKT
jgi:hypothetical protein